MAVAWQWPWQWQWQWQWPGQFRHRSPPVAASELLGPLLGTTGRAGGGEGAAGAGGPGDGVRTSDVVGAGAVAVAPGGGHPTRPQGPPDAAHSELFGRGPLLGVVRAGGGENAAGAGAVGPSHRARTSAHSPDDDDDDDIDELLGPLFERFPEVFEMEVLAR